MCWCVNPTCHLVIINLQGINIPASLPRFSLCGDILDVLIFNQCFIVTMRSWRISNESRERFKYLLPLQPECEISFGIFRNTLSKTCRYLLFQNWSRRTCSVSSPVREVDISRYICWHKDEQIVRAAKRSHGEKTSINYQPKHSAHMFLTRCSWSGVSAPAGTHHRSAASCRDVHISRLRPQNTTWKIGAIIFKFLPVHHFFNMNSRSSGCRRSQLFLTDVCLIYILTSRFFLLLFAS